MANAFLQSTSQNFLSLSGGMNSALSKAENSYNKLIANPTDLCKRDTKSLQKDINNTISQLNAITKIIGSISTVLDNLLAFMQFTQIIISGLIILTEILKFFPAPAMFSPMGTIVRLSDLLNKINSQLKVALLTIIGLDLIIKYLSTILSVLLDRINTLISKLNNISDQLKVCNSQLSSDLSTSTDNLKKSSSNLSDKLGTLLKSNDSSYKGFTFQIFENQTTLKMVAKRRYAVAFNSEGIKTLQGELSYATDTQILINELKLIIDSRNLNGFPNSNNQTDVTVAQQLGLPNPNTLLSTFNISQDNINNAIDQNPSLKNLKN